MARSDGAMTHRSTRRRERSPRPRPRRRAHSRQSPSLQGLDPGSGLGVAFREIGHASPDSPRLDRNAPHSRMEPVAAHGLLTLGNRTRERSTGLPGVGVPLRLGKTPANPSASSGTTSGYHESSQKWGTLIGTSGPPWPRWSRTCSNRSANGCEARKPGLRTGASFPNPSESIP